MASQQSLNSGFLMDCESPMLRFNPDDLKNNDGALSVRRRCARLDCFLVPMNLGTRRYKWLLEAGMDWNSDGTTTLVEVWDSAEIGKCNTEKDGRTCSSISGSRLK